MEKREEILELLKKQISLRHKSAYKKGAAGHMGYSAIVDVELNEIEDHSHYGQPAEKVNFEFTKVIMTELDVTEDELYTPERKFVGHMIIDQNRNFISYEEQ